MSKRNEIAEHDAGIASVPTELFSFNRNTVQPVAEQRELPGESLQKGWLTGRLAPIPLLHSRSLNGIAFNRQPTAYADSAADVRLRLTAKQLDRDRD